VVLCLHLVGELKRRVQVNETVMKLKQNNNSFQPTELFISSPHRSQVKQSNEIPKKIGLKCQSNLITACADLDTILRWTNRSLAPLGPLFDPSSQRVLFRTDRPTFRHSTRRLDLPPRIQSHISQFQTCQIYSSSSNSLLLGKWSVICVQQTYLIKTAVLHAMSDTLQAVDEGDVAAMVLLDL
jgi:hypothetical protein